MDDVPKKLTKEQQEALQRAAEELFVNMGKEMDKEDNEPHMHAGGLIPTECDCCRERKRREWLDKII